jgi:2-hydroxychromene-2-carboxylate isomerase
MIIAKRLKGKAISTWLGPTGDAVRRAVTEAKQKLHERTGGRIGLARRLDFYFDITDPWSYLLAQAVARLVDRYPVELGVTVITPPASDVDPAPALRTQYAVRDARYLSEYWNVDFAGIREADPGMVRDVGTALIKRRPAREQLTCILELAGAMWAGDRKTLTQLLGKWGTEAHGSVPPILNSAYTDLRKAGHYQGAVIHYGDSWYVGIERVAFLEQRLAEDFGGATASDPVLTPRPDAERGPAKLSDKPLTCELWFAFESPFAYLALEQIEAVLAPYAIPLVLRPIAVRGSFPTSKRLYLARDAKRAADRLGVPFGELCVPSVQGIDHCLALVHWASQRGAGLALARSLMRGIWAEARDVAEYVDLRFLVERAGLPWDEAQRALGDKAGATAAHENAADLNGAGLWGVPSFRVGELVLWGQDRLPLLADRLRRHALATTAATA